MAKRGLTTELLCDEAREFSEMESTHGEPSLFGVTDGKAVGTYLEHKFQAALHHGYISGGLGAVRSPMWSPIWCGL